jgi:hypothetical protein
MISVLISLIIALIVLGLLYYVVTLLPLPAPFPRIIQILFVLILILWILQVAVHPFGGWHGWGY